MTTRSVDAGSWCAPANTTAAGAVILGAGLLLGPTPSDDTAEALRDIDGFRLRYVVTNAVALVGILVMAAGLLMLARRQMASGGGMSALVGGAANAAGGVLIALTLVLQSTVEPLVSERFVDAGAAEQQAWLAVGETVLDLDGAVFGAGFLLQMLGIAIVAVTFLRGADARLNRWFLALGAALAASASTMGIGALFEDVLGDVEALLGLGALLWLIVLSALLLRTDGHSEDE